MRFSSLAVVPRLLAKPKVRNSFDGVGGDHPAEPPLLLHAGVSDWHVAGGITSLG
jgi:hypothetical protein